MYKNNINCPQCGSALPLSFRHSKLRVCDYCGSSIFLEDDAVRLAGKQSVPSQEPSLIQLQQPFVYKHQSYLPIGHIRYSYGKGFWDEWWVINNAGQGIWLTVDEGDFAFQKPTKAPKNIHFDQLSIDTKVGDWLVTERGHAVCQGYEGELPELVKEGDEFDYVDLSKRGGKLLSLEFTEQGIKAYKGFWLDPFDIQVQT